jgi:hypothetical protein
MKDAADQIVERIVGLLCGYQAGSPQALKCGLGNRPGVLMSLCDVGEALHGSPLGLEFWPGRDGVDRAILSHRDQPGDRGDSDSRAQIAAGE